MRRFDKITNLTKVNILLEQRYLQNKLNEEICIDIKVGDIILGGKFKNKKITVKDIDKNEKGEITINGKPLMRFRLPKPNDSKEGSK